MQAPIGSSKEDSPSDSFVPADAGQIGVDDVDRIARFLVQRSESRQQLMLRSDDLLAALAALPDRVEIIVFLDDGAKEDGVNDEAPIASMLTTLVESGVDAVIQHAPATDAIKRVTAGLVAGSIDRAKFGTLRAPEVLDRRSLEQALGSVDGATLINPTVLVAANGGSFDVFVS